MALKITTEPREERQLGVRIEVDPERVEKELRKAARKAASDYRIPGFRKGKAPYHIVVQMVGLPTLYNEFVDELGQELYKEAIEQEKLEPYATAALEDVEFEPLAYKLLIPLEPEIDLGDYRALRVEEEPVAVSDEDIDARLATYQDQHSGWQEVTRPSQYGDLMNINVRSVIINDNPDAEETVVLDETDWDVTPDQENPMEPPGFDEALLGLEPNTQKEFELSWPADSQSIYAGKSARFSVTVNQLQAYEKPELNDEFAQLVGPDYATLEDLKNNIRTTLEEQQTETQRANYAEKVLNALVEQSTLTYPPVVVEDQMDSMIGEFERQLQQLGIESLESYLRQTGGGTLEEYRERLRPEAKRLAEQNLVLSEVLRLEKLKTSDEDIEERIKTMMGTDEEMDDEAAQSIAEMLRSGGGRAILDSQLLREKALDLLLAVARGEDVPLPPADEPASEGEAEAAPSSEDEPAAEASSSENA